MAFTRKAAIGLLRRAHENNRLAHAYLISGPIGSGKRQVAAELASVVNGTAATDVFSSKAREIFVAEPESKSRRILIEQIRQLEHGLQMRAAEGRRKVAIIAEADRLQPQAANAFLKTLEEPPANSLLLLLSALPEALPDTIVSRCVCISLSPNGEEIEIPERGALVDLLREAAREKTWEVRQAYKVGQGMQSLLGAIKEQIKTQTGEALKKEEERIEKSITVLEDKTIKTIERIGEAAIQAISSKGREVEGTRSQVRCGQEKGSRLRDGPVRGAAAQGDAQSRLAEGQGEVARRCAGRGGRRSRVRRLGVSGQGASRRPCPVLSRRRDRENPVAHALAAQPVGRAGGTGKRHRGRRQQRCLRPQRPQEQSDHRWRLQHHQRSARGQNPRGSAASAHLWKSKTPLCGEPGCGWR